MINAALNLTRKAVRRMINAALNLLPGAVGQGRPQIIGAVVADNTAQTPAPASFSDPLFVINPSQPDSFWRVDSWPAIHGNTKPAAAAEVLLAYDHSGTLRCLWWLGAHT